MNIQMLLSANQSQGSGASTSPTTGTPSFSNGLFRQAMMQATDSQPRLSNGTSTAPTGISENATHKFATLLESLGIELDEGALAGLFEQLQQLSQPPSEQLGLTTESGDTAGMPLTALQEISSRLSLMAAFTGETATPKPTPKEATSAEAIASQLSISEQEAALLISAFSTLQGSTPNNAGFSTSAESLSQKIANLMPASAANTAADHKLAAPTALNAPSTYDTATSMVRLTSEALASAAAVGGATTDSAPRMAAHNEAALNLPSAAPQQALTSSAPGTVSLQTSLNTPVTNPAWPSQLGQQLVQFAQRGGEQHVQMKLHPAELGPLSVSLKMTEHGAQAHFLSAHAQVRQIIEQAIPQLREALAEQGISLSDTSVGEQGFSNEREAFAQQSTGAGSTGDSGSTGIESEIGAPTPEGTSITIDGRVDLYA
ncbi:flagellar hook-length control protein FliK [Vreelandella aquamarina]|uniref:flagellar hook-length control protein FliK n=1 Tax=Vreelandella aquamarina TaxID=77097 RepID=UPI00384BC0BC